MTQLEIRFSIETKRDIALNALNLYKYKIQKEGSCELYQKYVSRYQGQVEAYDEMLAELRAGLIQETLREWQENA
jgi:hypothetical protein